MTDRWGTLRGLLALLVALLIAGAYTAPSASAAGLRAAKCCAERCEKPRTPDAARHCCPSLGAASDVGSFTVSAKAPSLETSFSPLLATLSAEPRASAGSSSRMTMSPRAAPLFLRTLSLRL